MTDKELIPKYLRVITALATGSFCLVVALLIQSWFLFSKKVSVFAVNDAGVVIPLVPLDQPFLNDSRIAGFVEECLRTSFSHDFENYRMSMANAKACYTPGGAELFEGAMRQLLTDITTKNLVLSAAFEPTVVTKVYKISGVVYWETQTPMTLYRRGTREALAPQKYRVESVVRRVSLDEHVRGISLKTINLKPAS
ncbi:MAG: DotI/IcmL family type IV secretion protein [Pseudomonadota bacterium]